MPQMHLSRNFYEKIRARQLIQIRLTYGQLADNLFNYLFMFYQYTDKFKFNVVFISKINKIIFLSKVSFFLGPLYIYVLYTYYLPTYLRLTYITILAFIQYSVVGYESAYNTMYCETKKILFYFANNCFVIRNNDIIITFSTVR